MNSKWIVIMPIGLLLTILGIGFSNISDCNFWDASAVQLLTPLIAVCLTFFATQQKNDQREAKKHAEALVEKIQRIVSDDQFYKFPSINDPALEVDHRTRIQMTNRKLKNCIDSLKQYGNILGFSKEATYIEAEFKRYRELVDESLADFELLSKLERSFQKHATNIDAKCDSIIVLLYAGRKHRNRR